MLRRAGVSFRTEPASVDEDEIRRSLQQQGANVVDMASLLAEMKALNVSRSHPQALVVGADQILQCGGRVFSKPENRQDAVDTLQALRGRDHKLISAVVIAEGGQPVWRHVGRAALHMRDFSDDFMDAYLDEVGNLVFASVGCYQLEGPGAQLFNNIEGDYFTILGMPLLPVLDYLRVRGMLAA